MFDPQRVDKGKFNLIAAGCGTGKSWFVAHKLLEHYPDIRKEDIIFVTSRSMTVDQQSHEYNVQKFDKEDTELIRKWNDPTLDDIERDGIQIMTYDKIISIVQNRNNPEAPTLGGAKIIVLDECHTLFSDASFISGMNVLQKAIKDIVDRADTVVIGMTATPGIIDYHSESWGVRINRLNDKQLIRYLADKMMVTDYQSIPYIITSNRIHGRTMVICHTVEDCQELRSRIPNSAMLMSANSTSTKLDRWERETAYLIRKTIAKEQKLPDKYLDQDGNWRELKVLLCTSTAREGFNLVDESENRVRNIISCFTDSMTVTQFAGRARYNLDTLIVADTPARHLNNNSDPYLVWERKLFDRYMTDKDSESWYKTVAHLFNGTFFEIHKAFIHGNAYEFAEYINAKWLLPVDATADEIKARMIYRDEDKEEIIDCADRYRIFDKYRSALTFNYVINGIQRYFGYTVETGQKRIKGYTNPKTYKLIVAFDEEAFKEYVGREDI